jgi:hypothetical protein
VSESISNFPEWVSGIKRILEIFHEDPESACLFSLIFPEFEREEFRSEKYQSLEPQVKVNLLRKCIIRIFKAFYERNSDYIFLFDDVQVRETLFATLLLH